jgi:hypothetical protein
MELGEMLAMNVAVRTRLVLAAAVLAAVYYYLLVFLIGLTSTRLWPAWWYAVFPSRHMAAVTWMAGWHTIGVIGAALPAALAAVFIMRSRAALLGALAGALATIFAVLPSLSPNIWPLIWNNHPIFFVTDQIKLLVAVPFIAWIVRKASASASNATGALSVS